MTNESAHVPKANPYTIEINALQELSSDIISKWADLESTALEANAFLSPHFVLPAARHLEKGSKVFVLTVNKSSTGLSELVGLFVFKINTWDRFFPIPHIAAFHSRHSYLSGMLVDKHHAEHVVPLIFEHLIKLHPNLHGITFEEHSVEGDLYELEKNTAQNLGLTWIPFTQWDRSILYPNKLKEAYSALHKRVLKNFRRGMRGLGEEGEVKWELIAQGRINASHINEFARLENLGWKGEKGSSLLSDPNNLNFFREMIENFNQDGRALFTELKLNGQPIASTSNVISGNMGFAFKIGWDPIHAKHSPGILNEISLLESNDDFLAQLECFDSGTSAESTYITNIWPGRKRMETGVYIHSKFEKIIKPALQVGLYPTLSLAKKIKQKINQAD